MELPGEWRREKPSWQDMGSIPPPEPHQPLRRIGRQGPCCFFEMRGAGPFDVQGPGSGSWELGGKFLNRHRGRLRGVRGRSVPSGVISSKAEKGGVFRGGGTPSAKRPGLCRKEHIREVTWKNLRGPGRKGPCQRFHRERQLDRSIQGTPVNIGSRQTGDSVW